MDDPSTTSRTDDRSPIDRARDVLARRIESEFPGVTITRDVLGWRASRDGVQFCRAQSEPGLRALIPYTDPGPDTGHSGPSTVVSNHETGETA